MDWVRVKELQEDLGPEDFEEIAALFLEEVEDRLAGLSAGNLKNFASDMHFLKGSAANLGFSTFKDACEALELSNDTTGVAGLGDVFNANKSQFLAGLQTKLAS